MSLSSFAGLFEADTRGKVGMTLKKDIEGRIVVDGLAPGGPAEQAGVVLGDILELVDGLVVKTVDAAGGRLSGPVGSDVILSMRRGVVFGSHSFDIRVTRKDLSLRRAESFKIQKPRGIAEASSTFSNSSIFDHMHAAVSGGVGLGVKLKQSGGTVVISAIGKGGGADNAGGRVQTGDVIVEVDDEPAGSTPEAVSKQLTGARGSTVRLRLRRVGVFGFQVLDVECVRADEEETDFSSRGPSSAEPFQFVNDFMTGRGSGAGIACEFALQGSQESPQVIVVRIVPDGPAGREGNLRVGDRVLLVDDRPIANTLDGVRAQVQGERGTWVVLKVERDLFMGTETRLVRIKRDALGSTNTAPPRPLPPNNGGKSKGKTSAPESAGAYAGGRDEEGFLEKAAYMVGLQVAVQCCSCRLAHARACRSVAKRTTAVLTDS
jgi:C-terminal processing protease CtpA/Prc